MKNTNKGNSSFGLITSQKKELCTEVGFRFRHRQKTVFDYFFFSIDLATHIDKSALIAAEALAVNGTDADMKRLEAIQENENSAFHKLQTFGEYQSEVMCIRLVDNYLSFLSELIQVCVLKNPEILRSSEQVKIEEVLQFSKTYDLVRFLVDRKINELSFGGIWEIERFLETRTGVLLVEDQNKRNNLSLAIALRNLYTHNRGIVDSVFIERTKRLKFKKPPILGKRLHADFDLIVEISNALFSSGCSLDNAISSKFKIRTKRYETWLKMKHNGS